MSKKTNFSFKFGFLHVGKKTETFPYRGKNAPTVTHTESQIAAD